MRFLTGPEIQAEVKRMTARTGEVMAAVAYWGTGAAERTGLAYVRDAASVRIICDLLSGACKPDEIERLMNLGVCVRTLDRLHAKVWINGDDVVLGSANASRNGLPGEDEHSVNVEAAILSQNPSLARELGSWFENQWRVTSNIDDEKLATARQLWDRRRQSPGRAFTSTVIRKMRKPGATDRFFRLRLVAYPEQPFTDEAGEFLRNEAKLRYSDEEWKAHGDVEPFYEWAESCPKWSLRPGTVLMDFSCPPRGEMFTFNGFWQVKDSPTATLKESRLTLLTKLPHFDGYSVSKTEVSTIVTRVQDIVAQRGYQADRFGFYIDMNFLDFWDSERTALKRRLVAQVVEAARELCRTDRFDQSLTLRAIRACKEDVAWLSDYARYVGGGIYQHGNHLKHEINREIGRGVRTGVGAVVATDGSGKDIREDVADEIIQSYTLFTTYDPTAAVARKT